MYFRAGRLYRMNGYDDKANFAATDTISNTHLNPSFPLYNVQTKKIEISGTTGGLIYEGGLNYRPQYGIAIVNLNKNSVLSFNPLFSVSPIQKCVKVVDSIIFIGGNFNSADGRSVKNFVAYNYFTNKPDTTHKLRFNKIVNALEMLNDSILLIGGGFDSVDNVPRRYFVPYNIRTRSIVNYYDAQFDSWINAIRKIDTLIFFMGSFTKVNSISKNYLVAAGIKNNSLNFEYNKFNTNINYLAKVVPYNNHYFFSGNNTDPTIDGKKNISLRIHAETLVRHHKRSRGQ